MKNFAPIQSPSDVHIVYAEDNDYEAEPTILGLHWLVGVPNENINHFVELDDAANHIQRLDPSQPTVAIFDNNTIRSDWKGHTLAMHLLQRREEHPNLIVVTISSSDMGLVTDNAGRAIKALHELGGEFWAKHSDGYLMQLWLGECLRTGSMTPRNDWMEKLGMETRYRELIEDHLPQDFAILALVDSLSYGKGKEQRILEEHKLTPQPFFNMKPETVLTNLGFPPSRGIEVMRPISKR